jgi:hypothetical protein
MSIRLLYPPRAVATFFSAACGGKGKARARTPRAPAGGWPPPVPLSDRLLFPSRRCNGPAVSADLTRCTSIWNLPTISLVRTPSIMGFSNQSLDVLVEPHPEMSHFEGLLNGYIVGACGALYIYTRLLQRRIQGGIRVDAQGSQLRANR